MSCITQLLEMKGDREFMPVHDKCVIEGGGLYKGFEYLIVFVELGHRCGYVAIPSGLGFDSDDLFVHGGITFEDESHSAKDLLPVPCNDTWLGFDAAHWGDMRCSDTALKYFGDDPIAKKGIEYLKEIHADIHEMELNNPEFSHKTFEYMEEQCKYLIDQLIEQAA